MTYFTKQSLRNITLSTSLLIAASFSVPAFAEGGSVHHSGQASKHSVLALAEGGKGSLKVASAVVAAPLIVSGGASLAVGSSIHEAGDSMADSAQHSNTHTHVDGPLEVTDIIITADPAPDQVLKNNDEAQTTVQEVKETHTTTITTEVSKTKIEKEQ